MKILQTSLILLLVTIDAARGQDQSPQPLSPTLPPAIAPSMSLGPDGVPRAPATDRVSGKLRYFRSDVKSMEAWNGATAQVGDIALSATRLVPRETLEKLEGREVEVLYHTESDGEGGRWEFFPPGESGPVGQGPVGHGAEAPIMDGGVVIGIAQWHEGRSGGYPALRVRELKP